MCRPFRTALPVPFHQRDEATSAPRWPTQPSARMSQRGRRLTVMEPDREQADLPAEQPPPSQDPRLPPEDADPCRPRDPAGPPAQRSRRALGLSHPGSVLPAAHRLRSSTDFAAVTRYGRRARCGAMVVYLLPPGTGSAARLGAPISSKVGLVVGKGVGRSVVRHRVSRRLRAQLGDRLDRIPAGTKLVVRALPQSARVASAELGRDLDRALNRLTSTASTHLRASGRSGSSR